MSTTTTITARPRRTLHTRPHSHSHPLAPPSSRPGFSDTDFSWDAYTQHRPAYPPSLWAQLLAFHAAHGGHADALHDMGAGAGQCAAALAPYFANLYVSDAVASNLAAAQRNLASDAFRASLDEPCRITFAHKRGEDQDWIAPASLDMLTVCEALHWMDPDATVAAVARALRPGGTFAGVHYGVKPWIKGAGADDANALLSSIFSARLLEKGRNDPVQARANAFGGAGMDYVPLGKDQFTDVTRVYVNIGSGDYSLAEWREGPPVADSRIGRGDRTLVVRDEESWSREVDAEWFDGYFASLQLGLEKLAPASEERARVDEFRRCIRARGTVTVVWPVAIVLASRR